MNRICMSMLLCLSIVFGGAVLAAEDPEMTQVRKAIDAGNAQYVETMKEGDAAAFAELFTDDGAMLSPHEQAIHGNAQIRDAMEHAFKVSRLVDGTITTVDVYVIDDLAYETGKYSFLYHKEGKEVTHSGRYVEVWKRQPDGSWRMHRDIGVPQD